MLVVKIVALLVIRFTAGGRKEKKQQKKTGANQNTHGKGLAEKRPGADSVQGADAGAGFGDGKHGQCSG